MHRIEDIIKTEGYYVSTSIGNSMLPFLRDRKDTVTIQASTHYKKFDIVLYKRNQTYILHRIIRILDHDTYLIRGDNCYYDEYVKRDDIIGVLTQCYRGEKEIKLNSLTYKLYVYLRVYLYPIRLFYTKIKNKLKQ